jgi:hypothetical protein
MARRRAEIYGGKGRDNLVTRGPLSRKRRSTVSSERTGAAIGWSTGFVGAGLRPTTNGGIE